MRAYLRFTVRAVLWASLCPGALGVLIRVLFMFGKVPPIAESGAKPTEVSWYSFWIPIWGVFMLAIGSIVGLVGGSLLFLVRRWRSRRPVGSQSATAA